MDINVSVNKICIANPDILNSGEAYIHKLKFNFSEEYTQDLVYRACFTCLSGTFVSPILNNECEIPPEALEADGTIELGVYAYILQDNTLEKRFSPEHLFLTINAGSYREGLESEAPTPTEQEQWLNAFNQNYLEKVQLADEEIERAKNEAIADVEARIEAGELNGATFIPNVSANGDISWTNDKDLPNPVTRNIKGDTGLTPNIQAGTTTTLTPESNAYVEIVGTTENPIINFYIPRGRNGKIEFRLVNSLPQTGEEGVVYLVPSQDPEQQNVYDEFIWINNTWERFGSASIDIDLSRYYTKDEIATILLDYETKQELISTLTNYVTNSSLATTLANYVTSSGLATTLLDYVTTTDLATELTDYVKDTDYATNLKGGVIKVGSIVGTEVNAGGLLIGQVITYANYENANVKLFISKGTLENVITGKELVNKTYVDTIVGDINTLLDELNGEVI